MFQYFSGLVAVQTVLTNFFGGKNFDLLHLKNKKSIHYFGF